MRLWRFVAGPESVDQLQVSLRTRTLAWSSPPGGQRGDAVVIYGTSPIQGYVAAARLLCDPVAGDDAREWAWLQIQPLALVLTHDELAKNKRVATHKGLGRPSGGSYNEIAEGAGKGELIRRVTGRARESDRDKVMRWLSGEGRLAKSPPTAELSDAWWEPPETPGRAADHEEVLSKKIATGMVRRKEAEWLDTQDVRFDGLRSLECRLALPHGHGRADIVLVEDRPRTLRVVEVKKRAAAVAGNNPVDQVLTYRQSLLARLPGWRVRSMIVARDFQTTVLDQARAQRVECVRCDANGGRLREA